MVHVKICGLKEPETLRAAVRAGADWLGFNFYEKSPRFVTPAAAATLLLGVGEAVPVALMVDPSDDEADQIAGLGFPVLQLHGTESPQRVGELKARTGLEVWKALGVAGSDDLKRAEAYGRADRLLLDSKPPRQADLPGGSGHAFDWTLLADWKSPVPWLLAGGLTAENIAMALSQTSADAVDVSSGVERARGVKDSARIKEFIRAAKGE